MASVASRTDAPDPIAHQSPEEPRNNGISAPSHARNFAATGGVFDTLMDDRIRDLLKELGTAINESISNSEDVNRQIQRLRDEGYNLYVVLDATIGLNRSEDDETHHAGLASVDDAKHVQFRINVNDLGFLRSLGIDPTRKVKRARSVEPLKHTSDD